MRGWISFSFQRKGLLSSCGAGRKKKKKNSQLSSNGLPPSWMLLLQYLILLALLSFPHYCFCNALSLERSDIPNARAMSNSSNNSNNCNGQAPLFSVGMIADIQYAPIPDGASFSGTPRYYRHSLEATKYAFATFRDYQWPGCNSNTVEQQQDSHDHNNDSNAPETGVDFVINLGDIIDGKCQEIEMNGGYLPSASSSANDKEDLVWRDLLDHPGMLSLLEIQNAMKTYTKTTNRKVVHSYGNHCLYNLNRSELRETLGIPFRSEQRGFGSFSKKRRDDLIQRNNPNESPNQKEGDDRNDGDNDDDLVGYYSYVYPPAEPDSLESASKENPQQQEQHSIKFIVLDGYDIALMRRSPEFSQKRVQAMDILQRQNGKNLAAGNENSPEGLEGLQKRFVAFNGAVGSTQLEWLRDELESTRQQNNKYGNAIQKVIVLSHQPIHPGSSNPICLIWNYDDVLGILREYSDVVVASFSGHAHKGGYALDQDSGIHFRVVEAVLESKPPTKTFGILDVYFDRLELTGHGDCESAVYHFDHGPHIGIKNKDANDNLEESKKCPQES